MINGLLYLKTIFFFFVVFFEVTLSMNDPAIMSHIDQKISIGNLASINNNTLISFNTKFIMLYKISEQKWRKFREYEFRSYNMNGYATSYYKNKIYIYDYTGSLLVYNYTTKKLKQYINLPVGNFSRIIWIKDKCHIFISSLHKEQCHCIWYYQHELLKIVHRFKSPIEKCMNHSALSLQYIKPQKIVIFSDCNRNRNIYTYDLISHKFTRFKVKLIKLLTYPPKTVITSDHQYVILIGIDKENTKHKVIQIINMKLNQIGLCQMKFKELTHPNLSSYQIHIMHKTEQNVEDIYNGYIKKEAYNMIKIIPKHMIKFIMKFYINDEILYFHQIYSHHFKINVDQLIEQTVFKS